MYANKRERERISVTEKRKQNRCLLNVRSFNRTRNSIDWQIDKLCWLVAVTSAHWIIRSKCDQKTGNGFAQVEAQVGQSRKAVSTLAHVTEQNDF